MYLASLALAGGCQQTPAEAYDLWIRNGTVIDGTGREPFQADVLVNGDTIVLVGEIAGNSVSATRTIDARGKIVAPGFIDTHAHGEPANDSFLNFLAQGITTVLLGQDGITLSFDTDSMEPLAQSLQRVAERGSEVNVATLSGHGSLRMLAGVGNAPEPSPQQLAAMQERLRADLKAGAFGLSFGLEYAPSRYSRPAEHQALGAIVGEYGGVVMSHLRSEDRDKIGAAINELLQIDARVHVSHIKIVAGQRVEQALAVLEQLERARALGKEVTADVYPYLASASNLVFLYPKWARSREQYEAAVRERRADLEAHLRKRVEERNGPQAILFTGGPHAGMRLTDLARRLGKPYERVLIEDIGYGGPPQAHFLMSAPVQEAFLYADRISICTDGAPGSSHPRSAGSFIKVLEEHTGEPPRMSFERAIYKMSGLPASILDLDRGVLAAGRKADLVVLSPDKLQNRASWSEPTLPPGGVDLVFVNGELAYASGKLTGRHGRVLTRSAPR